MDLFFSLPRVHVLSDFAFEAGTAKHAFRPPAVEGTSVQMLKTGTHAAQSAEVSTTFRRLRFLRWIVGYSQDLAGLHLIERNAES